MGFLNELKRLTKFEPDDEPEQYPEFPPPHSNQRAAASTVEPENKNGRVLNIHTTTQLQVVLVQPEHFESASDIADHLRDRRTVVLNLEKANRDAIRRLVDFLSGVVYSQGGKIKPVARNTYIITPYNVDIMGGDLMDELESNGWYV